MVEAKINIKVACYSGYRGEETPQRFYINDGKVEVVACGEPEAVDQLREWMRHGPPNASVSAIACEPIQLQQFSGFAIG